MKNAMRTLLVCLLGFFASTLSLVTSPTLVAQSINDQRPARIVAPPAPKLDINRASVGQLMRIHGLTQSYAQRIVTSRPYSNKGQLKTKGILPPLVYDAAKDKLIAHRMK